MPFLINYAKKYSIEIRHTIFFEKYVMGNIFDDCKGKIYGDRYFKKDFLEMLNNADPDFLENIFLKMILVLNALKKENIFG